MKKNLKRTLAKVMAVALTVAMAGTAAPDADAAKKIKLSSKFITVVKGKSKKVTIKNVKKNKVKKLTVKSDKKKIATVKKAGKTAFKVTGKKAGSAKITASVTLKGKKKATKLTLKVKVKKAVAPTPAPSVAPAATATASAPAAGTSGNPAPGTSGNPAPGTSGNPAPGTSGNPTPGTSGNPDNPTPAPQVQRITLSKMNMNLTVAETESLSVEIMADEGADTTATWNTDNAEVATVSNTGLVTAVAKGTAKITVKVGTKTRTCTVTVYEEPIQVEKAPYSIALTETNESVATSNWKRALGQIAPDGYHKNLVFNEDGSVSFDSSNQYNTGAIFYAANLTESHATATPYEENGETKYSLSDPHKTVDLSDFKYMKVVVTTKAELCFRLFNDADSFWNKKDAYEGVPEGYDKESGKLPYEGDNETRTVYFELSKFQDFDLKYVDGVCVNPQDAEGESITVHSIEFVKVKPLELEIKNAKSPELTSGYSGITVDLADYLPEDFDIADYSSVEICANAYDGNEDLIPVSTQTGDGWPDRIQIAFGYTASRGDYVSGSGYPNNIKEENNAVTGGGTDNDKIDISAVTDNSKGFHVYAGRKGSNDNIRFVEIKKVIFNP